tara:strand:- start:943 stop:1467 length:525 start_codon:yes stop_codon:yes gene_type:complete
MIQNLFEIKYFRCNVDDWQTKKKKIELLFDKFPDTRNGIQKFLTNRQTDTSSLRQPFVDILKKEFDDISQFIKKDVGIERLWSVSYEKYDYHLVHNHGHKGFTGILYMDIKEEVPPTTYVQPWTDPYSDMTMYYPLNVKEGTLTVVPRFVSHFSQSNETDFKKRIIAFDMDFNV